MSDPKTGKPNNPPSSDSSGDSDEALKTLLQSVWKKTIALHQKGKGAVKVDHVESDVTIVSGSARPTGGFEPTLISPMSQRGVALESQPDATGTRTGWSTSGMRTGTGKTSSGQSVEGTKMADALRSQDQPVGPG